jgi:DNA-binding MarR family transcriptional regulator
MFFLKALPTNVMVDHYLADVPDGNTTAFLQALTMMRQASVLIRGIERHFAQHGLSQLKFLILIVIDREQNDDGLRHQDVSERIDVSKPVLSRSIRTLVKEGFIVEAPDDVDTRALRLKIASRGTETLRDVLPGYIEIIMDQMVRKEDGV